MRQILSITEVVAIIIIGMFIVASNVYAKTPAEESVCDGLTGRAYGLCNAYCEAMDCDMDHNASDKACEAVLDRFVTITGFDVPCEDKLSSEDELSPGDTCEEASGCVGEGTFIGTTSDNSLKDATNTCQPGDSADEWWCYTPSCTGTVTIDTCTGRSDDFTDTTLAVFDSCGGSQIACNDDSLNFDCGFSHAIIPFQKVPPYLYESDPPLSVTVGNTYYIRVSSWNENGADYVLNININCTTDN